MKARLAGTIFNAAKKLPGQTSRLLGIDKMGKGDIAMRFGMDGLYATMGAMNTPGDFGDKLIAGGGDFITSAGAGLVAGAPFQRFGPTAAGVADNIGSVIGWQLGQPAIEGTMRAKDKLMGGEGLSPYERSQIEYEDQFREQIMQELASAGLLRDESTGMV